HVGARQDRQPDHVDVLLERRGRDHLRRLPQSRVDDFEALVAQTAGEHLGATVVPVEAGLRDEDLDGPVGHAADCATLRSPLGRRDDLGKPSRNVWRRRRPAPASHGRIGMGQAFARLNVREAIQTATAARAVVIPTPIAISGLPQSLLNSARAASVAWVNGLRLLRNLSQSGASAIGNRIPDSRSSGMTRLWTSGANASSLLRIRAAE